MDPLLPYNVPQIGKGLPGYNYINLKPQYALPHKVDLSNSNVNPNALNTQRIGKDMYSMNPNTFQTNNVVNKVNATTSNVVPTVNNTANTFSFNTGNIKGLSVGSGSQPAFSMGANPGKAFSINAGTPTPDLSNLKGANPTAFNAAAPKAAGAGLGLMKGLFLGGTTAFSVAQSIRDNKQKRKQNRMIDRAIRDNNRLINESYGADQSAAVDTRATAGQTLDELRMSSRPEDRAALSQNMGMAYSNMGNIFGRNAQERGNLVAQNQQWFRMKQPTTSPFLAGIQGAFQGLGGSLSTGVELMSLYDKYKNPNKYMNMANDAKGKYDYDPETKQYYPVS